MYIAGALERAIKIIFVTFWLSQVAFVVIVAMKI